MSLATLRLRLREERGVSMIELLVATASGLVVSTAALTILIVSLHQSSRITERVAADQAGRAAMNTIVGELHSTCLSRGLEPIQEKSGTNVIYFRNAYSKESSINASKGEAYEHKIEWSKTAHTLTDYSAASSSGEVPSEFKYAALPSTGTPLASNVTQTEVSGATKPTPIFKYYKYATAYNPGTESSSLNSLTEITLASESATLGTTAKEVAAVLVTFTTAPESNYEAGARPVSLSSQVTFAIGLPSSEAAVEDSPCK